MKSAVAINTHRFQEAINKMITAHKEGEIIILWGLIRWPRFRYEEHLHHTMLCKICGQKEFNEYHGYYKVDDYVK